MVENLKTTKYNDGTGIPLVSDDSTWASQTAPALCWYNNDSIDYGKTYGALYNYYAVDMGSNGGKNVCPAGWHVPNATDRNILFTYLGGEYFAGAFRSLASARVWVYVAQNPQNDGFSIRCIKDN
jgi:uncharacterized protein (TIGR02145 family)